MYRHSFLKSWPFCESSPDLGTRATSALPRGAKKSTNLDKEGKISKENTYWCAVWPDREEDRIVQHYPARVVYLNKVGRGEGGGEQTPRPVVGQGHRHWHHMWSKTVLPGVGVRGCQHQRLVQDAWYWKEGKEEFRGLGKRKGKRKGHCRTKSWGNKRVGWGRCSSQSTAGLDIHNLWRSWNLLHHHQGGGGEDGGGLGQGWLLGWELMAPRSTRETSSWSWTRPWGWWCPRNSPRSTGPIFLFRRLEDAPGLQGCLCVQLRNFPFWKPSLLASCWGRWFPVSRLCGDHNNYVGNP